MRLPNVCGAVGHANASAEISAQRARRPAGSDVRSHLISRLKNARQDGKNSFEPTELAHAETCRRGGGDYLLVTSFSKSAAEYIMQRASVLVAGSWPQEC